ncbi:MAG: DNA translocase FtsK, partial [Oscillospiraceae bacterium]|nr:DNA translocase FtsK [Oscillospiraceae bacterium]
PMVDAPVLPKEEQVFTELTELSNSTPLSEPVPNPEQDAALEELIRKATEKPKKKTKEEEKLESVLAIADEVAQLAGTQAAERPYAMPRLDFLDKGKSYGNDANASKELRDKADLLQQVLESFNVEARITNIARGPSVTRYEVQPAAGVKVSRITSLANDIALNFATEGVRIEAPIPGKPAIGIEVPNSKRDTVALRDLLESKKFIESKSKLVFGVGKDIAGNVIIGDIAKMPHMIIAGATGSGKSVCTNSIIMSILYHATPDEVKLILIDPKIVEFRVYDGIPHLLIPVVTDPKKAAGALNWAVQEMLKRYDIFAENGVRNLAEFNEMCKNEPTLQRMPQIVICIDELAELMMTASKEVEDAVCRLAQLARAAGMHLIIATQRPTTNIITGLIKANIPSRIALSVKAQIDSRVILDVGGAETLLGNGDMLYLPNGQPKPVRVQGCYVSTAE